MQAYIKIRTYAYLLLLPEKVNSPDRIILEERPSSADGNNLSLCASPNGYSYIRRNIIHISHKKIRMLYYHIRIHTYCNVRIYVDEYVDQILVIILY